MAVAACTGSAEPPAGTEAESTDPAWDSITSGIVDGEVPLDVALAAFTLTVGPLPGVDDLSRGPVHVPSGTGALRWTLAHWEQLTAEQQAAVEGYLSPGAPTGRGPVLAMTGRVLAAEPDEQVLAELIAQVEDVIAQNLGRDLGVPIELHVAPSLEEADADALTNGVDAGGGMFGPMAKCVITLTKNGSDLASDVESGAQPSGLITSLMAHEVFHCFEMALSIDLVDSYTRPPWVVEGLAEWVGETVAGGSG